LADRRERAGERRGTFLESDASVSSGLIEGADVMIPISHYLIISAILFITGAVGVLLRHNALIMLMSLELMLNAVNLSFVAYARMLNDLSGHVFVFLGITVAAAEAAVGLAIILTIYRAKEVVDADTLSLMRH
jgi:NADH-quinone oxidoreductase subunit K